MSVRLLHFLVTPVMVLDDGEVLTAVPPAQPSMLSLLGMRDLIDKWPVHLEAITAQLEPAQAEPDEEDATSTDVILPPDGATE